MLYKNMVIINASVESGDLIALEEIGRQRSVATVGDPDSRGTRR